MKSEQKNKYFLSDEQISRALRHLPSYVPPPSLTARLRVAASHERQRRGRSMAQSVQLWQDRVSLTVDNLMRPMALPLVGGLFSAVILFSMLVPSLPLPADSRYDIPTMLTTEPSVKASVPIGVASGGEAVVAVMIDNQGRMVDYVVLSGPAILADVVMRRRLENTLLFTEFVPRTSFGRPMGGWVRLSIGLSHIEVKG